MLLAISLPGGRLYGNFFEKPLRDKLNATVALLLLHCCCCIALHVMSLHMCIMRHEHGLQQATAPFDVADSGRPGTPIGPDLVGGHYISY